MKFTVAILSAFASVSYAVADGLLCVDQNLIDVFDSINKIRSEMTSASAYTALNTNAAAWADANQWWTTSDGTQEAIISG